jgi:ribosomal protein L32E
MKACASGGTAPHIHNLGPREMWIVAKEIEKLSWKFKNVEKEEWRQDKSRDSSVGTGL